MMSYILKSPNAILKYTRAIVNQGRNYNFATEAEGQNLKYESEWKKIYEQKNAEQAKALSEELTENQRKRIDFLLQTTLELSDTELTYYTSQIRQKIQRTGGFDIMKLNLDWPALKQLEQGAWPVQDLTAEKEALSKLWPMGMGNFAGSMGGSSGGVAAPVAGQGQKAPEAGKAEESKEEKKAEKSNFDIELSAVDAAQKIKIIKEVRQLLNLGLKEAKEMVEKAPVVLKKEVKKEEAEKLKEVLSKIGCTITLL